MDHGAPGLSLGKAWRAASHATRRTGGGAVWGGSFSRQWTTTSIRRRQGGAVRAGPEAPAAGPPPAPPPQPIGQRAWAGVVGSQLFHRRSPQLLDEIGGMLDGEQGLLISDVWPRGPGAALG